MTAAAVLSLAAPAGAQHQVDVKRITEDAHRIVVRAMEHVRHAADSAEQGEVEQVERVTRTLKIGANGQLDLANVSGDIVVTGGGGDEIKLEAVKRGRGNTEAEAKNQLPLVTVEITERAGRAGVRTRYKEGERHIHVSVDYTVTAPAGTRVIVRSVSGDVKVTGIKDELDAESVSGDVTVVEAGQLARAKSVSGDVNIRGAAAESVLDASSVSGDVVVRGVKARRVEVSSVSGGAELTDVTCETATMKSVSGDVAFTGSLAKAGRYEFKSHSGDVRVTIPGDMGFELEASTFSGTINSDLPLTVGGGKGAAVSRRTIRGTFGDGSAMLNCTTFSGSVIIRKR
ncbi:MAG: hypothetical protein A3J75_08005 [Acidobacteria bacterium RBG_16_68_9]|nr:MAG: hypothetical protein A3J75_08005 [Acidobacteria bacterium RBG_16_68_9]